MRPIIPRLIAVRTALVGRLRGRMEASLLRSGLAVPWWVPVLVSAAGGVIAVAALLQRRALLPPVLIALAALLVVGSTLAWAVTGKFVPSWLKALLVLAAAAILLSKPVLPDFAAMLLVVLLTEMGAAAPAMVACVVAVASGGVLIASRMLAGLVGTSAYAAGILLGLCFGLAFRWYIRATEAERDSQRTAREQVLLAERQRMSREVHDVVAHSLSITLLHLTGARHALQEDHDIDEAVEALVEAERVGRAAMADIRRTVALLAGSSPGTRPLPGADDIAELVERTRAAGLDLRYEQQGDLAVVSASTGLGLYRIAQESLANIAKHAERTTAEIRLTIGPNNTRLTVRNGLPPAAPRHAASGSGLAGMSERATQLGADLRVGPSGDYWVVDVTVPSGQQIGTDTP
jgi:signal transduction histidine kinase